MEQNAENVPMAVKYAIFIMITILYVKDAMMDITWTFILTNATNAMTVVRHAQIMVTTIVLHVL